MGFHFIGEKKLNSLSRFFNIVFIGGYELKHEKGAKIWILEDLDNNKYGLLIYKNLKNLKRLNNTFGDNYEDFFRLEINADFTDLILCL